MKKRRIALVGCGRIAAKHLESILDLNEYFELVGICEIDEERRGLAEQKYKVPTYFSLPQMLKETSPAILSVCTPSGLHWRHSIQGAEAGCHVVCEKPMATRFEEGRQMIEAADLAGVKLFVVKQNRLNSTVQLLKNLVDGGKFGKISLVQSNVFWTRHQEYYDQADWRGTWDLDGGALMNQASHYVDLLGWLFGPIESVQAYIATLGRKIEAEDCGTLNLKWRNGSLGNLAVSMLTYSKNFEGSVTVIGEKGLLRLGGTALNKFEHWAFAEEDPALHARIAAANYETDSVYGFGHKGYYAEVAKALDGLKSRAASGREGLVSLQTLIAAYRSVQSHSSVSLPLGL